MKNKKYILFDLDGTLTDSSLGIINSVKYALSFYNIYPKDEDLSVFIGPPLKASFMKYYNFDDKKAEEAVSKYRENFKIKGIYENRLYDGVGDLLNSLSLSNKKLYIATSKPDIFTKTILDYFGISKYITDIFAPSLGDLEISKGEIISQAINKIKDSSLSSYVMVGDTKFDIIGANENQIDSIGVDYGFGLKEELVNNGANFIVNSVDQLKNLLL